MEQLEFHSEAKDPQMTRPLPETQQISNDTPNVKNPQKTSTSPAKITSPKPKPALPSSNKPRIFELDLNKPTNSKPGSSKALEDPQKGQTSNKKLPEPSNNIIITKSEQSNPIETVSKPPSNQEIMGNINTESKGHQITDSIQTVIRKDSSGHANDDRRPSAGINEIPTPFTLKGSFQSATGQAQYYSASSISNLLRSAPEYQRSQSHQPKTEPNSTKDLKMKGFTMQIDNIINNCFTSFLHRSFSPAKPSNFSSHKQENSANLASNKPDPGFFSSDEKKRPAPPFFDNLGREMDGVLRKIKAEIAQKTDIFTHNYRGDAELRKSRFITEVQQAVKSSLEELEQQVPGSGRGGYKVPSIHKDLAVQTGEKTPVSHGKILAKDLEKNGTVDKEFIEEIVKKTTNEMVLSLMKSNLLDTPGKRDELSKSLEDLTTHANQKEASFLTTNFQKKKAEILNQIEYIDREIEQMVKRDESLENSVENVKNSFLSSPLELPDPYFKPKIKSKNSNDTKSKIISNDKTHSISASKNNASFKPEIKRIKSPPPPPPNTAKKDRDFVRKIVTSRPIKSNNIQKSGFNKTNPILSKTANAGFKRTNPQLSSFEERNRKWLEEREMKIFKSKEKMDGQARECTFKPTKFSRQPRIDQSKDRTLTTGGTPERKKKDIEMTPVNFFFLSLRIFFFFFFFLTFQPFF